MSSSIRISKKTHEKLIELAGILQANLKKTVTIDEAINFLLEKNSLPGKISELSEKLDITDKELEEINKSLEEAWKTWDIKKYAWIRTS
ncbi:MAG: hypothetical protein ACTSVV_00230 [Promethearchaeota archaeon]